MLHVFKALYMHGGAFDCIVHHKHDKLTVWETFIATKDDNWLLCLWLSVINYVRYEVSIMEHSNCGNYVYSKEVFDNTTKHWVDVVIVWLVLMVTFAHE